MNYYLNYRIFDSLSREKDKFPPHDLYYIEDDDSYVLLMAVAGYDVEISVKEGILEIRGKWEGKHPNRSEIHYGIRKGDWQRAFVLGEYIEVKDAKQENGILSITFKREVPEELKPKQIPIIKS